MSHTTLMPPPNRPPSSHSHSPRRTPVPLLLEAFPVPPTHIPPHPAPPSAFNSPSAVYARPSSAASGRPPSAASGRPPSAASFTSISSNNPPPSRPPAAPLPPVPGPSPISEQETLLFLNSSVKSSRSCPSVYSNSSPRSSLSGGASMTGQCSGNSAGRRMSVASGRSVRSIASSNAGSFTSNVGSYTSTGGSYTSSSPSSGSLSAPATVAFPRSPSSPAMTYSISEEDPADLTTVDIGEISLSSSPVPLSDDETAHEHAPVVFPVRESDESLASIDMGDLPPDQDNEINHDLDALELHRAMRASRSRSEMHKRILRARSTSPASRARSSLSPSNSSSPAPAVPPLPTSHKYQPSPGPAPKTPAPRPDSPDISTILATTPRPRRTSSTPGSRSRSRPRTSMRRRVSEGVSRPDSGISVRVSRPPGGRGRAESPVLLAYMRNENWEEGRFVSDYGVPLEDGEKGAGTLEVCEDDGSDSDSSLDLHTPLPHLMLRHGLLSPNSKLLPGSSRATSPMTPSSPDARPGSMLSVNSTVGSVMTKSGVFKDDRDTPRRRVRHRDGKLLKAGMGLTTGLGWSDSEDEDAPSPLTRRISSLNLSRKASAASVGGVHPLSRSFSGEPVPRRTAAALVPRASLPHKRSEPGYISASSSFQSDARGDSSTTSTHSLSMPSTPVDLPPRRQRDIEKGLPPIPRYPSGLSLRSNARSTASSSLPRPGTHSSASSISSAGATANHSMNIPPTPTIPTTAPTTPRTPSMPSMSTPRQLKLPQSRSHHQLQQSQHHSTPNLQPGEQPPAPGRLLTYNRNLHDQQRMRIASGPARPSGLPRAPPSPVPPMPQSSPQYAADPNRPRPRIGAGMVYRKSTSPTAGSRMRTPSTRTRAPPVPQSIAL